MNNKEIIKWAEKVKTWLDDNDASSVSMDGIEDVIEALFAMGWKPPSPQTITE